METKHTETVVEKAVAYVKDMLGLPPGDEYPGRRLPSPNTPIPRVSRHRRRNAARSAHPYFEDRGRNKR